MLACHECVLEYCTCASSFGCMSPAICHHLCVLPVGERVVAQIIGAINNILHCGDVYNGVASREG